uniref:Uncharacterized protein n=1 Tax=uncultured bacterium contig00003 TaxID=1181495 RepID=A0A806KBH1_9BACT|nr:hypothetical protein [uncultured bacterium contig00003]
MQKQLAAPVVVLLLICGLFITCVSMQISEEVLENQYKDVISALKTGLAAE